MMPQEGRVSYAVDPDRERRYDELVTYGAIDLGNLYPGINVRLKATGHNVEKLFTIAPYHDPAVIRLRLDGANELRVTAEGALEAETGAGSIRFSPPEAFQTIVGTRQFVAVRYVLNAGTNEYGFALGPYDPGRPVTIDPLLQSTFVGGSGNETATALAIHPMNGEVYIAGYSASSSLPATAGAEQTANAGAFPTNDAYVTRLDAALTHRLQTTFIGDVNDEIVTAMAIHPVTNDVYITGYTSSAALPATAGAEQTGNAGIPDAFVTRLNAALTQRLRTTFVGGTGDDRATALAINPVTNEIIIAGSTASATLPATAGAEQTLNAGGGDGFITRLDATLSQRLRTTFIGDSGLDTVVAVAVHPMSGEIIAAGYTSSTTLPASAGAPQPANAGGVDGFITRLDSALAQRLQTTFVGGTGTDLASAIAIHPLSGDIYVTGQTQSPTFPGTAGSQQMTYAGNTDVFVTRHNALLTQRLQSTYIGGTGEDNAYAMSIHPSSGEIFVAGYTSSVPFPATAGAAQPAISGTVDAFVTRLNRELTLRVQTTFVGGPAGDVINAIALHPLYGDVFVAGHTSSVTFPGSAGAEQTTNASAMGTDVFVARLTRDLTVANTTPTPFGFPPQVNVPPASMRLSSPVQMAGLSGLATIHVEGQVGSQYCVSSTGTCSCNVIPFTAALGTVADAQYVCVRHVSAAIPNKVTETILHVGGEAGSFFVTTGSVFAAPCSLDVDGNGAQDALSDGLMILRALFGLTGTAVTNNAVGSGAVRGDWTAIRGYLNGNCGANFAP
ncbi:MAG: hypothetical protein IPO58_20650 [Betaproteobacteria bacterium]|nr:hypothetical protein [Betaproteobacteria bacterium]